MKTCTLRRSVSIACLVAAPAAAQGHLNWSETPLTNPPPPRGQHAAAYDSVRGRLVIYGGRDAQGPNGDLFEWDGIQWTQPAQGATTPGPRFTAMCYDTARSRVVLFGGGTPGNEQNDTWEWDGVAWTQATPVVIPPPRRLHALAYDEVRERVVLFGGGKEPTTEFDDTWEWDGSNWTELQPTVRPSQRKVHSLAYDQAAGRVMLFGGISNGQLLNDTWEWDGTDWSERFPANSPSPRKCAGVAYDEARQRIVLFGGNTQPGGGGGALGDTWEWNGLDWTQLAPTASPTPRSLCNGMAYFPPAERCVAFGGLTSTLAVLDDHWEYGELCGPVNYCSTAPNSVGQGGLISAIGSFNVTDNNFLLSSVALPPNQFGLYYYGPDQIQVPFGDGFRCVGDGAIGVFRVEPPGQISGVGELTRQVDFTQPPANAGNGAITAGSAWNFQGWYRDPTGPGGNFFNLTDAVSVLFCP